MCTHTTIIFGSEQLPGSLLWFESFTTLLGSSHLEDLYPVLVAAALAGVSAIMQVS